MKHKNVFHGSWRLYLLNWIPLGVMAVMLGIALSVSRFSLEIEYGLLFVGGMATTFVAAGHLLITWKWGGRLAFVLVAIAQLELLFLVGTPLTYIAASANLPLQDDSLAYCDRLLGLDWRAYYDFFIARPLLITYACLFYALIKWPTFIVPAVLGLTSNHRRLQQFVLACVLTVCVTAAISTLLPAIGTYQLYDLPASSAELNATGYLIQLARLPLARDGTLRSLVISEVGGIITFPSFHAAAAILALWGFWGVWWMRPFALITSVGTLVATPLLGGHYFVDVIAGSAVAALAIVAAKRLTERTLARSQATQTAPGWAQLWREATAAPETGVSCNS
jgi:membrane-associated phospholipid phosphatase